MNTPLQLIKRYINLVNVDTNEEKLLCGMYLGVNLVDAEPSVVIAQIIGTKTGNQFIYTWNNSANSERNYTDKVDGWFATGVLTAILVERRFNNKDIETVNTCVEFLNAIPLSFDKTKSLEETFVELKSLRLMGEEGDQVKNRGVKNMLETFETYYGECIDVFNRLRGNEVKFNITDDVKNILTETPVIPFEKLLEYDSVDNDLHIETLLELKWTRFRSAIYDEATARRIVTHVTTDDEITAMLGDSLNNPDKEKIGSVYWPRFITLDIDRNSKVLVSTSAYLAFKMIIGALLGKIDERIVVNVGESYIDIAEICRMAEKIIVLNPTPKRSMTDSAIITKRKDYVANNVGTIRRQNLACIFAMGAAYKMPTCGSMGLRKILEMWNLMVNLYQDPDVEFNFFDKEFKFNEKCKGHVAELMLRVYVDRFVMTDVDPRLPKPGLQWGNYARYLDGIYQNSKKKGFFPLFWPWEGTTKTEIDLHSLIVELAYAYPSSLTDLPSYLQKMVTSYKNEATGDDASGDEANGDEANGDEATDTNGFESEFKIGNITI